MKGTSISTCAKW